MQLICCLHLIFGNLFVLRTLEIFRTRSLISTNILTKIGTTSLSASLLIAFFLIQNGILCSISLIFIESITVLTLIFLERRQIDTIKAQVPVFLDQWILNLKLGMGITGSREVSLKAQKVEFQALVSPIFATQSEKTSRRDHLILSPTMVKAFADVAREPHSALARLETLRELFRKSADFRRKSGQAMQQTKIQCTVMLVLQFALSLFTIHHYGWSHCGDLVIAAAIFSSFGVAIMRFLSRKRKWKI